MLLNSNINQQSIYSHFPANQSIPLRLMELLDWLSGVVYDEMGYFPQFIGNSLDRYFPALNLSPYFGSFAQLDDGSLLAYWFYEGGDRHQPPIVMISAEGDLEVIANSIEEWVARLIRWRISSLLGRAYGSVLHLCQWTLGRGVAAMGRGRLGFN